MVCSLADRRSRHDLARQLNADSKAREAPASRAFFVFMTDLLPLFLNLNGRDVLLVGAGTVVAAARGARRAAAARPRRVDVAGAGRTRCLEARGPANGRAQAASAAGAQRPLYGKNRRDRRHR